MKEGFQSFRKEGRNLSNSFKRNSAGRQEYKSTFWQEWHSDGTSNEGHACFQQQGFRTCNKFREIRLQRPVLFLVGFKQNGGLRNPGRMQKARWYSQFHWRPEARGGEETRAIQFTVKPWLYTGKHADACKALRWRAARAEKKRGVALRVLQTIKISFASYQTNLLLSHCSLQYWLAGTLLCVMCLDPCWTLTPHCPCRGRAFVFFRWSQRESSSSYQALGTAVPNVNFTIGPVTRNSYSEVAVQCQSKWGSRDVSV